MDLFKLVGVKFNDTIVKAITNVSLNPAISTFLNRGGGKPFPFGVFPMNQKPVLSVTTNDIGGVLGLAGVTPLAIGNAKTCDLWFGKMANGGDLASGSVHQKISMTLGVLVPRQYRATHGQEASATFDVMAVWDGTNNPFTVTAANQALPAGFDAAPTKYTLGPMKIGSTLIDTQSLTVDCGIQGQSYGANGEPYDRIWVHQSQELKVTGSTADLSQLTTLTSAGTSAAVVAFFQKLVNKTMARVALATAEHLSVTLTEAYVAPGTTSGGMTEASQDIEATANWNGTQALGIVSTAAAIA